MSQSMAPKHLHVHICALPIILRSPNTMRSSKCVPEKVPGSLGVWNRLGMKAKIQTARASLAGKTGRGLVSSGAKLGFSDLTLGQDAVRLDSGDTNSNELLCSARRKREQKKAKKKKGKKTAKRPPPSPQLPTFLSRVSHQELDRHRGRGPSYRSSRGGSRIHHASDPDPSLRASGLCRKWLPRTAHNGSHDANNGR